MAKQKWAFDEAFLSNMQLRLKLDQERDAMKQDIAMRMRQLSLLGKTRQQGYELNLKGENRLQKEQDIKIEKTEYDIKNDYEEVFPSNLINQTGKGGAELNKEFSGLLNPFSPTKFYKPKQGKQEVIGIWETINQNSIDPKTGRPATLLRNKLTNEERYEINYEKPEKLTATEIENDIKRKETKKAAQSEYDAIMKSRRVTKEELLTRDLVNDDFPYGGAYLYQGGAGLKPEVFITDRDLENFAEEQVPNAPNKWKIKNDDPLGIR